MLCMICNTNNNTVKCTQPNKHGFAYVIHYDNNGEAIHKHYRFINADELPINPNEIINVVPTPEPLSEKNGSNGNSKNSDEPNENQTQEKNGSNGNSLNSDEPNESVFDSSNISSDNISDNKRKRRVPINVPNITYGKDSRQNVVVGQGLPPQAPTEDNML